LNDMNDCSLVEYCPKQSMADSSERNYDLNEPSIPTGDGKKSQGPIWPVWTTSKPQTLNGDLPTTRSTKNQRFGRGSNWSWQPPTFNHLLHPDMPSETP
jgi:hypothetical protein